MEICCITQEAQILCSGNFFFSYIFSFNMEPEMCFSFLSVYILSLKFSPFSVRATFRCLCVCVCVCVCVCLCLENIYFSEWKSLSNVWFFATPWTVCSLPGSSVHGILQARRLKWVAISFTRGSSWLRDQKILSDSDKGISFLLSSISSWVLRKRNMKKNSLPPYLLS